MSAIGFAKLLSRLCQLSLLGALACSPQTTHLDQPSVNRIARTDASFADRQSDATEWIDTAVVVDAGADAHPCNPPCDPGTVCFPEHGCVPDCRLEQNECPQQVPHCDQASGICFSSLGDAGLGDTNPGADTGPGDTSISTDAWVTGSNIPFLWGVEAAAQVNPAGDTSEAAIVACLNQALQTKVVKLRFAQAPDYSDPTNVCSLGVCYDYQATAQRFQQNGWTMFALVMMKPLLPESEVSGDYTQYLQQQFLHYANFVDWLVAQFAGTGILAYLELVNDPGRSWNASPEALITLTNMIYSRVKTAHPNLQVGTPGFEYFEEDSGAVAGVQYVEAFLDPLNNAQFDFWAFHGYRTRRASSEFPPTYRPTLNPYAGITGILQIRQALNNNGWQSRKILDTEHSFLFPWNNFSQPDLDTAAAAAVQSLLLKRVLTVQSSGERALAGALPLKIRPRCQNGQGECLWGSLQADASTTPVITAVAQLWSNLKDYTYTGRVSGQFSQPHPWVEKFHSAQGNSDLFIAFKPFTYTNGPLALDGVTLSYNLPLDQVAQTVTITDLQGQTSTLHTAQNVSLLVENAPQYVEVFY